MAKMTDEVNYKEEIEALIKPRREIEPLMKGKSDEDLKIEFLDEYQKLCRKYGMSFMQGNISIVKVDFPKE